VAGFAVRQPLVTHCLLRFLWCTFNSIYEELQLFKMLGVLGLKPSENRLLFFVPLRFQKKASVSLKVKVHPENTLYPVY
jgi:hypothetical protein